MTFERPPLGETCPYSVRMREKTDENTPNTNTFTQCSFYVLDLPLRSKWNNSSAF